VRSQNTIAAIELGKTRKSRYLPDIARVLNVSLLDLDPGLTDTRIGSVGVDDPTPLDLDVYATRMDGECEIVTHDPVERVQRPAPLATVKGAYGVIVAGESMVPLLRPGDIAFVHPHLPPKADDLCLFRAVQNGRCGATIQEYRGQTLDAWQVRRYSPKAQDLALKRLQWPHCHVIVGKFCRR
jgi:hypothetical protein